VLEEWLYHAHTVQYKISHRYTPDFVKVVGFRKSNVLIDTRFVLVEAKAIFRDGPEAAKYKWIRDSLPADTELVFLFQDPNKELWFRKKRKDGTRMTNREWAERNRFQWFTTETFPKAHWDFPERIK